MPTSVPRHIDCTRLLASTCVPSSPREYSAPALAVIHAHALMYTRTQKPNHGLETTRCKHARRTTYQHPGHTRGASARVCPGLPRLDHRVPPCWLRVNGLWLVRGQVYAKPAAVRCVLAQCWHCEVHSVNTVTLERPCCGCMIGGRVLRPRLRRGATAHTPIAAPQPPPSPCNTSPVRQPPGCIALPSRRFAAGCPGCQWLRWCRGALRPITGAKKIMCKRSAHACVDHSPPAGDICMCCYAALQMC